VYKGGRWCGVVGRNQDGQEKAEESQAMYHIVLQTFNYVQKFYKLKV
jgi:hypothetical protein